MSISQPSHAFRIERLKSTLETHQALLIEDKLDLFYLTGFNLSAGKFLVTPQEASLLVDSRYFGLCSQSPTCPVYLHSNEQIQKLLQSDKQYPIQCLQFDSSVTPYQRFQELEELLKGSSIQLQPTSAPLQNFRAIKDAHEIEVLGQAGLLCVRGMEFALASLREGVTELQLARELEIFWLQQGGEGLSFDPIIAFGPNSAYPHYRGGNVPLKRGDIVLLDMGVTYKHYQSDMTRTVFFGEPDVKLLEIHHYVAEAKQRAIETCRPGITAAALDQKARDALISKGIGDYFVHGLGHGVGLNIHEYPGINSRSQPSPILQEGMVITIEPGAYITGLGGVRLEDTFLIQQDGAMSLTPLKNNNFIVSN